MFPFRKFIAVSVILLCLNLSATAQTNSKQIAEKAYMAVKVMEKYHIQPVPLNDDFSEKLYKSFLKDLDPSGSYFTKKDLETLENWKTKLDDEINSKSTVFLEKTTALYKQKLLLADTIIGELLAKPVNFTSADTIRFSSKKDGPYYSSNDDALKKRWNKWLKYQVLTVLYTPADETDKPFEKDAKTILLKEPEARNKIKTRNKRTIKRILESPEGFENYIASLYLNNIVSRYDPHSSYFSPTEKQSFESSISADVLSFGVYFDENADGEIAIDQLVPGGAAWQSNQMNKGDILLKVKPTNAKEIEITNVSTYDVYEIINNITSAEAEFTIRKENGQVKTVQLAKSKIRSDENVVKSYILKGEKKIGYISLPSFYTEWENENPLGCANDVAKEIIKLQEENIDGLVLDLRYNGGGSVREAISLAGIFIDEGPLAIYKTRQEKPYLLKDINRGKAYNGPLVVMANGSSASASEIFSAAVQNYNCAVIAGSATHGKATGQIIIPVDTTLSLQQIMAGYNLKKENTLGFIKITTEKFYHVTQSTHQQKGVIPDVLLPEPLDYGDYKESSYPNAIAGDSIVKKVVYTPLPVINTKALAGKSALRIQSNANFIRLKEINDSLTYIKNGENSVVLTPQNFTKGEKAIYRLTDELYTKLSDSSKKFTAINNNYDKEVMHIDIYSKEINDVLLKNIQNDIYIDEVYNIISDLINFDKK